MARSQPRFFYRCYSDESAGQLRSGRYHDGHQASSEPSLISQFDIHRRLENREPTALVSVTERPLEALNRALAKYHHLDEDPGNIWIVIIRVPDGEDSNLPHHAQSLARQYGYADADAFKYEYLFEWEIPLRYVEHSVSVKTLIRRGIVRKIDLDYHTQDFPNFGTMRRAFFKELMESDLYGIGRWVGSLAQVFGAIACTYEIAIGVLHDCLGDGYVDDDDQRVYFYCADIRGSLEFSDICGVELGIQEQLEP